MAERLQLPLSGVILGHLIEAFDLRRCDPTGALSTRNATRIFSGERVDPKAEEKIWIAAAEALLASDLLPPLKVPCHDPLNPRSTESVLAQMLAAVPIQRFVGAHLGDMGERWDALVGSLRRLAPPVGHVRLAYGAALRLGVIDVSVRLAGLLWLAREDTTNPLAGYWAREDGLGPWLKDAMARCEPALKPDELAHKIGIHENTVDGWLYAGARPTDDNLRYLAQVLSKNGLGNCEELLRGFRLTYAMRHVLRVIREAVGPRQAEALAQRLVGYPALLLHLKRNSQVPDLQDTRAYKALGFGAQGGDGLEREHVEWGLGFIWQIEGDPVWRTSLKAATGSWFDHLQWVATKLPPTAEDELREVLGELPPLDQQERIGYLALATKEEMARDPRVRAAMDSQVAAGGRFAAIELKLRGSEAERRGDLAEAIDLFGAALKEAPRDAELHFRLGACLWQADRVEAGLLELEIAAQLAPGWDRAHGEIAIVLLNLGRPEEAVRRLELARPLLREPSAWLLLHLASAHERLGDAPRAIEVFGEVIALEPEHGEALDHKAHLHFVLGDWREGDRLAKRAAHFGFTDVRDARERGYYDETPTERPPRTTPKEQVQLVSLPRRSRG
jgi:hypothetical protein